ncbi:MAG: Lar family restriction alleviation protein [Synergistaceae bacterium]|nr:Lar family restriction alleviation protein [Synergistaceae bacterium]
MNIHVSSKEDITLSVGVLKKCPFCGEYPSIKGGLTVAIFDRGGGVHVQCDNCLAVGSAGIDADEAVKKWNNRCR